MKKIFALALAAVALFTVQAQEQDVKAMYEQAKNLEKVFDKAKANPDAAASESLIQAFDIYGQVMAAEANSPKPKYTEKIQKSLVSHAMNNDFQKAAVALFNGGKQYPQAYSAFVLSGQSAQATGVVPDTVYAIDFLNAGNSAYGNNFEDAAAAYDEAIKNNINDVNAYIYAIGARQNLAMQNPDKKDAYYAEIYEIAKNGVSKFGVGQDFLYNNYMQKYFDNNDFDTALAELAEAEKTNPNIANIYRLRGIISNAKHDYLASIPAFVKMAELTDNFDYLNTAAEDLNTVGKAILGQVTNVTPEDKQLIIDIFNNALNIANKAKTAPQSNPSKVEYLIEDINYNLENANKL